MSLSSSSSAISPTSSSLQQQTSGLQSLLDFVKSSNISEWQRELDATATELAARQEESESGRRKLVDQSKEFRQVASEDVRKTAAPLFKSFQTEVDNLSRRSRLAEAAFLAVYKRVIGIPDLYPLHDHIQTLSKRTGRLTDLELDNKQLRETLDAYNSELGEVRNQEYTIRSLKEKVKALEESMESKVQAQLHEREAELARKFNEKERQADEAVQEAVRRQLESEHRASTLQSSLSATQAELLEAKNKLDERSAAQSSEMEMLLGELDKTNERAASAEMEVVRLREQLRTQLSSSRATGEDQTGVEGLSESERLQNELASREKEISRLLEDVHRLQSSLNALRVQTADQVRNHERELSNKSAQLSTAELRLKEQSDYEELKRELEILKSIEFGGLAQSQNEDGSAVSLNQPVELLFAEKNKNLQSTVVQLRSANEQLQRQLSAVTKSRNQLSQQQLQQKSAEARAKSNSNGAISSNNKVNNGSWSGISSPMSAIHDTSSPMPSSAASIAGANSNAYPPSRSPAVNNNSVANLSTKRSTVFPDDLAASSPQSPPSGAINLSANAASSNFAAQWGNFSGSNGDELDTCTLAQQVREMLLANSIGQRLFAKHVLNLSQGTVSELLSKPKPWRKLTEKGKESYRRMAVWISNPNSLQELKELAPRKGPPGASSFSKAVEDVETEQKISKILEEAREEMMKEQDYADYDGQNGGNVPKSLSLTTPSSAHQSAQVSDALSSTLSDQHKSLRDIARYVASVQRQELVKLMQAAEKNGNIDQQTIYSDEISKLDERIRLIDTMPSEVLSSLGLQTTPSNQATGSQNAAARLTPSPFTSSQTTRSTPLFAGNKSAALSSSANKIKPPPVVKLNSPANAKPFDLSVSSSNVASNGNFPLYSFPDSSFQDSISSSATNTPLPAHQSSSKVLPPNALSSVSQSAASVSSAFQKPALPPISQEDVDKYAELSTESLVRRIKNLLAQYGISQRLFGEQTLGLSQGSVSDMLSRPKPWSQLTNKGREPFIRMAIFLDDPHGIHKLARKECSECHLSSFQPLVQSASGAGLLGVNSFEPSAASSPAAPSPLSGMCDEPVSMMASTTSSGAVRRAASPLPAHNFPPAKRQSLGAGRVGGLGSPGNGALGGIGGFDLRAAFELNTEAVAQQIKDVLSRFGVGQKVFAEQVLGMSQGSVSDLLNRPKPWAQLTLKGREPYIRMFLWLYDPILASQLLPPPKRLVDAAASSGSNAPLQPFVLPGLGQEASQAVVLTALVSPKDNGDGKPPLSAQEQMAAFFSWLQDQQLLQQNTTSNQSPAVQNLTLPSGTSLSSSSSFDRMSGSTPPPAHYFGLNRSSSMSTNATNLSANGSRLNSKPEPVDLSDLPPAFATEPSQPSPPIVEEEPMPQVPVSRSSKRKSANPSKRITNASTPPPASYDDPANGRAWNTASSDAGEEAKMPMDVCQSPSTSSANETEARQDNVERLNRGLATGDAIAWDGDDEEGGDRDGLIDRLERNCLPSSSASVGEAVGVGGDWDQ